jgi:hypothetical protein
MDWATFVTAFSGTIAGGAFALGGTLLQGRLQSDRDSARFDHESRLAAEEFSRKQAASENERIVRAISDQIALTNRVALAAGRLRWRYEDSHTEEQREEILRKTCEELDIELGGYSPFSTLIDAELLENASLRADVQRHRDLGFKTFLKLLGSDTNPDELPVPDDLTDEIQHLRSAVELRMRELQRTGQPL